jgi:hypothetical protein
VDLRWVHERSCGAQIGDAASSVRGGNDAEGPGGPSRCGRCQGQVEAVGEGLFLKFLSRWNSELCGDRWK